LHKGKTKITIFICIIFCIFVEELVPIQMSIEKLIGDLLLRHNCVIIPEFGGFVANTVPATIDYQQGLLFPPNKTLYFNEQLKNNDGLLIAQLAFENKIKYEQAFVLLRKKIHSWNEQLAQGERIHIERVGFLFYSANKKLSFKQDKNFNLLLSSYGLNRVHFLSEQNSIHSKTEKKHLVGGESKREYLTIPRPTFGISTSDDWLAKTFENRTVISQQENEVSKHFATKSVRQISLWKHLVAASIVPFLFYTFWIPFKTDVLESKIISFHDFNPFHSSEEPIYQPTSIQAQLIDLPTHIASLKDELQQIETNATNYSYPLTEDTYLLVKLKATVHEKSSTNIGNKTKEVITTKQKTKNYIVGCFGQKMNAEKLIQELKSNHFDAFIYDKKGGLYRVSLGKYPLLEDFQTSIHRANKLGYNGWILNQ